MGAVIVALEDLTQEDAPREAVVPAAVRTEILPINEGQLDLADTRNLTNLSDPSVLQLPPADPNTPTSEDATAVISSMQLPSYTEEADFDGMNTYTRDLLQVAKARGFTIEISGSHEAINKIEDDLIAVDGLSPEEANELVTNYLVIKGENETTTPFIEDTKIITRQGEVLKPNSISNPTMRKIYSYLSEIEGSAPTDHNFSYLNSIDRENPFAVRLSGAVMNNPSWDLEADMYSEANQLRLRETESYVEGGNALFGRKANGEDYAIIGEHSAIFTAHDLQSENSELLTDAARNEKIALLHEQPKEVLNAQIEETKIRLARESSNFFGFISKREALNMLADIEIAKDVIATDLNIARDSVTFIKQPGFHIDMHLQPLTPGKVLVNTYQETANFLSETINQVAPGSDEQRILLSMIDKAQENIKLLDPINEQIISQLETAGLEVIRTPGVFSGDIDAKELNFNFVNGVAGTVEGSDKQYLITNSPGIPAMQQGFEKFLVDHGIEQVYWVGGPRAGQDFTQSASRGLLSLSAGLNCIQTARTTEKPDYK